MLTSERNPSEPSNPWADTSGWRLNSNLRRQLTFVDDGKSRAIKVLYQSGKWLLDYAQQFI
ncbi:MAG: hypothetical protein H7240_03035 [Glaciimonas sp.]|nr:hypothetical protein [Glaciimonas sp.]